MAEGTNTKKINLEELIFVTLSVSVVSQRREIDGYLSR